ncbi:hypothetical protein [Spirosoma sp.]|uniref:hypothetical protein n=1 Tax=Spirosoma sp. TaxID=1899569 RepID=UPI0026361B11|nr:hypothetical protein [Spirosoma sp.]MCX6215642.1 hypothetical protein [Spirosoma sp.]
MTQAQHALIVTFLTQKCELIETTFIQEMTDHFVVSVEDRMTNSLSFEKALQHTIDDFGGSTNIQKMEWTYRKVFLKSLFRDWWALVKSQFARPKRVRALVMVGLVTFASLYFGLMTDFRGVLEEKILWSSVQWVSIIWVITLTWFLLQRVAPRIKKAVIVRFPTLLIRLLTYLLWVGALLLYLGISSLEMSLLAQGLSYSTLWSSLAILYLGLLDYSMQADPNSWYQTR